MGVGSSDLELTDFFFEQQDPDRESGARFGRQLSPGRRPLANQTGPALLVRRALEDRVGTGIAGCGFD